ncbi:MAG: energy-coupling factor transporter ATPase [Clostridiales bacterium]|nr:energy-coupling factor transporter ATPase [Clostridiales bacterium]
MDNFIEVKNVTFGYKDYDNNNILNETCVINNISFNVRKGEFLALLGHNGSGKSTLAKMFNGMITPDKGEILIEGIRSDDEDRKYEIRSKVGLVFQNPDNQIVASIVEEDVAFGPENLGVPPKEIRERVDEALKAVDMYEYRNFAPHKLSGGQKQRTAIAGIIAMQPDCIVLDEPTAMLDPKGRAEVMSTIKKLNKEKNITVILITHYMDEAAAADRVIVIDNGDLLIDDTPKKVFSHVKLLKEHGLDVPQSAEIAYMLKGGKENDELPINRHRCVEYIVELLNNN